MILSSDKRQISRTGRFLISVLLSSFLFFFIWIISQFDNPPGFNLAVFAWISIEGFLTWESIHLYQERAQERSNANYLMKSVLVGVAAFCIVYYIFKWIDYFSYSSEPPTIFHMIVAALIGTILSAMLVSVSEILKWRSRWYESRVENEAIQKDQIKAELNSLQSHIDPHFLFNNLNTLYSLIYKDPERAADFLERLSEIYRYILSNREEQVVPAVTELTMGVYYLELLKSRFGSAIKDQIEIQKEGLKEYYLPPLSIQQLIENAVKHNQVEEKIPLELKIFKKGEYLEISNHINRKMNVPDSHGTGLENLRSRISYLTDRPLEVIETKEDFCVKMPLLTKIE